MRTIIYKYAVSQTFEIELPSGCKFLTVQLQKGMPQLWVELDEQAPTQLRSFRAYGTGHNLPPGAVYIATWQEPPYVWHLYDVTNATE